LQIDIADYCRQIETYLCLKNEGHLIRVAGPSFERVARWASDGVPLKVAFRGIDRYCERYYRKGPRRRPVQIDFCEADVLDAFDQWRRAIGASPVDRPEEPQNAVPVEPARRGPSLPVHFERVLLRLTDARMSGLPGPEAEALVDRVAHELDTIRDGSKGLRGRAREAIIERLESIDRELIGEMSILVDGRVRQEIEQEADEELAAFRASLKPEAYARARQTTIDRLLRERLRLPVVAYRYS